MGVSQSSNQGTLSDRPLRLVSLDPETGRLQADQETLAILRTIHLSVTVVGAAGVAGCGKSSLLTRIIRHKVPEARGFPSSPSPIPCTTGLWISSQVWRVPRGGVDPPYAVLFLDTEGLFLANQRRRDMCHILSLAILLSSTLIYNEPGQISSSSMEMLTLSAATAGLLRAHLRISRHSNRGVTALSNHSPTLFWVLRDASLGPGMSPEAYLEQVTAHTEPEEHQPEPYGNALRRVFCRLFPARQCFNLARPATDERQLLNLDHIPTSELRAPFVKGLQELEAALCAALEPLRTGPVLTGPLLAELCEAYIAAANEGAIGPYLWQNAMEHIMQQQAVRHDGGNAQLQPSLRDIAMPISRADRLKAQKQMEEIIAVATVVTIGSLVVLIKPGIIRAGVRGVVAGARGFLAALRVLGRRPKDKGADALVRLVKTNERVQAKPNALEQ